MQIDVIYTLITGDILISTTEGEEMEIKGVSLGSFKDWLSGWQPGSEINVYIRAVPEGTALGYKGL